MKFVVPMSEKRLKSLIKDEACGVVPGLTVRVVKFSEGSTFQVLCVACQEAADWREKIAQVIDPVAEERAKLELLRRKKAEEVRNCLSPMVFSACVEVFRPTGTIRASCEIWVQAFPPREVRTATDPLQAKMRYGSQKRDPEL